MLGKRERPVKMSTLYLFYLLLTYAPVVFFFQHASLNKTQDTTEKRNLHLLDQHEVLNILFQK